MPLAFKCCLAETLSFINTRCLPGSGGLGKVFPKHMLMMAERELQASTNREAQCLALAWRDSSECLKLIHNHLRKHASAERAATYGRATSPAHKQLVSSLL